MNKTKVLLINPSLTLSKDDVTNANPVLGLAYLAAVLEKNKIRVKILDALAEGIKQVEIFGDKKRIGLSDKQIKSFIENFDPDVVGVGCSYTAHAGDAHRVAEIIKQINRKIIVVFGGSHASSNPQIVLQDKNIDVVIKGEGEYTLLELVKLIGLKKNWKNIYGTIVKQANGKIKENPKRPYISNLDELPFPARHLLPMETYLKERKDEFHNMRFPQTTMITSRGCPGNCIYCAVKTIWGRTWRPRSPKNVIDEIESLVKDYNIREIHFLDDSLSVDKKRLEKICDEIIRRKIDIKWTTPNGIAIWLLDEDLLIKMKKAGCYRLTFGLESGNRETLKIIGKNYSYEKALEMISFAHKIGFWTLGTFIIGFPEEKIESIRDTINFALKSDLDLAVFYSATPFPGTPLYDYFKKHGFLYNKDASLFVGGCKTKYFTAEELTRIREKAYSQFLLSRLKRPWRYLGKVKNFEDLLYLMKPLKIFGNWFFSQFTKNHLSTVNLSSKN